MKLCWAPETAKEMGRGGVPLRTAKGKEIFPID